MTGPSAARYDMRKNDHDEYWTVYDIFTGLPAKVNDVWMESLEMEEADDLVDLLNAQYVERRGGDNALNLCRFVKRSRETEKVGHFGSGLHRREFCKDYAGRLRIVGVYLDEIQTVTVNERGILDRKGSFRVSDFTDA